MSRVGQPASTIRGISIAWKKVLSVVSTDNKEAPPHNSILPPDGELEELRSTNTALALGRLR